jgi:hypothetical protein
MLMSDGNNGNNVVDILPQAQRDEQILTLRLSGVSVAQIGKKYRLSDKAVLRVIDKLLPTLSAASRARYLQTSIATLDLLQSWWTAEARTWTAACSLVLRICEQRNQLLGLFAPVRVGPIEIVNAAQPQPEGGSTQELIDALERISRERQEHRSANGSDAVVIEHEVD